MSAANEAGAADARLRAGLVAEASAASIRPDFAERVIAQAGSVRPPAWRGWVLPLVAAAVIAILLGSAVTAVRLAASRGGSSPEGPGSQPVSGVPASTASTASTTSHPSGSPAGDGSPALGTGPTGGAGAVIGPAGPVPAGFTATDLTWISPVDGWALGTAPCAAKPCTSIVRTTDGGRSWVGIPAPRAFLASDGTSDAINAGACPSATTACVSHLRFASAEVGYAFGQNSLFMTIDAGRTWSAQNGGALGLEIANGTALRLSARCLPGCPFSVTRAAVGSDHWTDARLPAVGASASGELARVGNEVVVANHANPAGGAEAATTTLLVSGDGGGHWSIVAEPCPRLAGAAGEVDTRAVTIAPDASITVLCAPRAAQGSRTFTMTSTDGGSHFQRAAGSLDSSGTSPMAAASAQIVLVSLASGLDRSADGGRTWQHTLDPIDYVGFESSSVGHALRPGQGGVAGSAQLLTTTDGGAHWSASPF